jgi:hypothetical protein
MQYCRYANPAMNIPAIIAISLTTFFMANPISSPPKNPPPTVAETWVMMSALKPQPPGDELLGYVCT